MAHAPTPPSLPVVVAALGLALTSGARAQTATDTGAERFARATALMAAEREAEAAAALEALARELPDDPRAPDALFAAGKLYEERLGEPSRALALYRDLVADYPTSRPALAAQRRADDLSTLLGPGARDADAVTAFSEIKRRYGELGNAEAIARVQALLIEHPDWDGSREAVVWLARVQARLGQLEAARDRYLELARRWPDDSAFEGYRGAGDMAMLAGELDAAERYYRMMPATQDPGRTRAIAEAFERLASERRRSRLYLTSFAVATAGLAALIVSLGFATRSLRATGRALASPPTEAIYFIPVAAVMIGAAFTGQAQIAPATAIMLGGGLAVTWLSGAGLRARRSRPRVALHALVCTLTVAAICYIALHRTRLIDFILETLRHGPER